MSVVASDSEKQLLLQIIKKLDAIEQKLDEVYPPEEPIREKFIKEVEKAEKRVKEGKFKRYTLEEFIKKFAP
jgi:uncharacterized membrane protein